MGFVAGYRPIWPAIGGGGKSFASQICMPVGPQAAADPHMALSRELAPRPRGFGTLFNRRSIPLPAHRHPLSAQNIVRDHPCILESPLLHIR